MNCEENAALSRRRAIQWLGISALGGMLAGCGGGGGSGSTASASGSGLVTIPTTEGNAAVTQPVSATPAPVVVDESTLLLHQLATTRGISFGSAYASAVRVAKPGPGGVGTLADFLNQQCALYAPGMAMLPDAVEWKPGVYTTNTMRDFIARSRTDGKTWRGHCLLYPSIDSALVQAAVTPENWRSMITNKFEAMAAVTNAQTATNLDVVNELMDGSYTAANGGYRPNHWYTAAGGPDYIVHAYKEARRLWPNTPLYWCHDHSEQITDSYHRTHVKAILNGIERAKNAGAPIDGYNMQGHLTIRLGFDAAALQSFLKDLTQNLGLKIIIGELDVHTGYKPPLITDTRPATDYTASEYDAIAADLVERFLDVALPVVQSTGKQIVCWGLSDIDNVFENIPGERPLPWDSAYQPKPMAAAIRRSLTRLSKV